MYHREPALPAMSNGEAGSEHRKSLFRTGNVPLEDPDLKIRIRDSPYAPPRGRATAAVNVVRVAPSRFIPTQSNRQLMDLMAAIARVASPAHPEACTQRAFDAVRGEAGHADCPTAQQICARLNAGRKKRRSWSEWLDITLNKPASFLDRSAPKSGIGKQSKEQTRIAAAFALRLARNEGDHHLSRAAYAAWRKQRIASLDEPLRYSLPTESQITYAYGNWRKSIAALRTPRPRQ